MTATSGTVSHISYLFKCSYFWRYSTCHFTCWLLLGNSLVAFIPPSDPLLATSYRNNKSVISVIALVWPVILEARAIDPFQKQTGGRRQNYSDSSHWCRSVCWIKGYFCANYSDTSREWDSSSYLNRKAWPSCRETLQTHVSLVAVTNLILFQHVN